MEVKIIKPHHKYNGKVDLLDGEANYLIRIGIAEKIEQKPKAPKKK